MPKPTARITDVSRAAETLRGIVAGIACDYEISDLEIARLFDWLYLHANLLAQKPFSELKALLDRIMADQVVEEDEREEILEWCQQFSDVHSAPLANVTDGIRRLHGFLEGIGIDGEVTESEVADLADWLRDYDSIRDQWPFDDVWELISRFGEDNHVSPDERKELLDFCGRFTESMVDRSNVQDCYPQSWMQSEAPVLLTLDGVCEKGPEVVLRGHSICFTGLAVSGPRPKLRELAESVGAKTQKGVTKDLDYLVVGTLSQPAWVYSTYGRKIEKVLSNRKTGSKTIVIHEDDFLRTLEREAESRDCCSP